VPIVVAAIGVVGTLAAGIAGVLITQRRADEREAVAWKRQRERERELWQREDMMRTFDHRRAAYVELISATDNLTRDLGRFRKDGPDPSFSAFGEALEMVKIYGSPEVIKLAKEAEINADIWLDAIHGTSVEAMSEPLWLPYATREAWAYRRSGEAILDRIREELQVPAGSAKVKPFDLD
jgi:hypothetical protein